MEKQHKKNINKTNNKYTNMNLKTKIKRDYENGLTTKEIGNKNYLNKKGTPVSLRYIQLVIKEHTTIGNEYGRLKNNKLLSIHDVEVILNQPERKKEIFKKRAIEFYKKEAKKYLNIKTKNIILDRQRFRFKVMKNNNYECSECKSSFSLEVHHIKPVIEFPELEFDETNGICLCYQCHNKLHNRHIRKDHYHDKLVK